jgi:putative Holliday junction resolvase
MRILGIDLGTKTMGLAITDNTQTIVSGISNFEFKKNDFKQCYNKIQQIINLYKNEIEKIVIGHPLTITGQKNS